MAHKTDRQTDRRTGSKQHKQPIGCKAQLPAGSTLWQL